MMQNELSGDALDAYNRMVEELKRKAMTELGLPASEIVVRPLRAEDVGFTNPRWSSVIARADTNTWSEMINTYTVSDNRFIGINGLHIGYGAGTSTGYTQLRVTKSGKLARIWNIQAVEDFRGDSVYFKDPVVIDQNNQLTIEGYALTPSGAATLDKTVFFGAVAEKRGKTTNP